MSKEVREERLQVLLVKPGEYPENIEIPDSLEAMQGLVGGLIQMIRPFEDEVVLICNDEGKLMGLPPNRVLRHPETGEIYDVVVGTFFLCAAPADSENFESLTEEQIQRYTKYFSTLEFFI